jgi:hypothetical protein
MMGFSYALFWWVHSRRRRKTFTFYISSVFHFTFHTLADHTQIAQNNAFVLTAFSVFQKKSARFARCRSDWRQPGAEREVKVPFIPAPHVQHGDSSPARIPGKSKAVAVTLIFDPSFHFFVHNLTFAAA